MGRLGLASRVGLLRRGDDWHQGGDDKSPGLNRPDRGPSIAMLVWERSARGCGPPDQS